MAARAARDGAQVQRRHTGEGHIGQVRGLQPAASGPAQLCWRRRAIFFLRYGGGVRARSEAACGVRVQQRDRRLYPIITIFKWLRKKVMSIFIEFV